jgi:ribosomal protein S18 acetylase RimI-like enzyme
MRIRPYHPDDLLVLKQILVDAFDGVSIDQGIEQVFGPINDHDWCWRKARHLDDDIAQDPNGIFVAELDGAVIGFISTWQDRESGIGHIPNIAIRADCRGHGWGRQLLQHALQHFRDCGLSHAKIETLQQNARGQHLYQSLGFREVARQIHLVADLGNGETK